nr:SGNH/GDSL hydrolase family protein [uncultured Moellerella sp.]
MSSSAPFDTPMHDEWICTWLSTSQPTTGEAFPLPLEIPAILNDQTLRQAFRISLGGRKLRLVFSNRYGKQPLILGESYISVEGQPDISPSLSVTFDGHTSATIPAGEILYSDDISLHIPSLSVISLRIYLPEPIAVNTFHWDARHFSLLEPGNQAIRETAGYGQKISSRLLLESLQVQPESTGRSIVVIGDSMVDGNGVEMDTYGRWTDLLAERLVPEEVAVVNAGQSGSRLLKDGIGISTLSRFDPDVLSQPGVSSCIVQVGLNDLGLAATALDPDNSIPTSDTLIKAYRKLLSLARKKNIRMIGVTLVPLRSTDEYGLENFYQPEKESIRQKVNQWMRTSGEFDALIDSDMLVRDPKYTQQLSLQYDSGDHLHLNYEGHLLIAKSISLESILPN